MNASPIRDAVQIKEREAKMRNLLLGAALAAATTLAALAPVLADDAQNQGTQAQGVDQTQTSSIGSSVTGEWLKLCINPQNSVICQGHATYTGESAGYPLSLPSPIK